MDYGVFWNDVVFLFLPLIFISIIFLKGLRLKILSPVLFEKVRNFIFLFWGGIFFLIMYESRENIIIKDFKHDGVNKDTIAYIIIPRRSYNIKIEDKKIISELLDGIRQSKSHGGSHYSGVPGTMKFYLSNGEVKILEFYATGADYEIITLLHPVEFMFFKSKLTPSEKLIQIYKKIIQNEIGKIEKEKNEGKK
jgi:hypothetical protein